MSRALLFGGWEKVNEKSGKSYSVFRVVRDVSCVRGCARENVPPVCWCVWNPCRRMRSSRNRTRTIVSVFEKCLARAPSLPNQPHWPHPHPERLVLIHSALLPRCPPDQRCLSISRQAPNPQDPMWEKRNTVLPLFAKLSSSGTRSTSLFPKSSNFLCAMSI